MAESPAKAIIEALAGALRQITVANGYNTDLGNNVLTERAETPIPSVLRCTVGVVTKQRYQGDGKGSNRGRSLRGFIELEVPTSLTASTAELLRAEEDVDRLLTDTYTQMPDALPVDFEEAIFLDRPDGMPVRVAEIHWSTGYRRNG